MLNFKKILISVLFFTLGHLTVSTLAFAEVQRWDAISDVDAHHDFTIRFTNGVNEESLNNENIFVTNADLEKVQGVEIHLSKNRKSITVSAPRQGYSEGETYILFIENTFQSIKGETLTQPQELQFTIQKSKKERALAKLVTLPKDTYDTAEVSKMIARISRMPEAYLWALAENDFEIRLINNRVTDQPEYAYLKGVVPRGWNSGKTWDDVPGVGGNPVIVRIGHSDINHGHGTLNLELHEIAHMVDYSLFKDISSSDEFKAILNSEMKNLIQDHPNSYNMNYFSYPEEYFAEAFVYFYLNDELHEELQQKAPRTYQLLLNLEKNF